MGHAALKVPSRGFMDKLEDAVKATDPLLVRDLLKAANPAVVREDGLRMRAIFWEVVTDFLDERSDACFLIIGLLLDEDLIEPDKEPGILCPVFYLLLCTHEALQDLKMRQLYQRLEQLYKDKNISLSEVEAEFALIDEWARAR